MSRSVLKKEVLFATRLEAIASRLDAIAISFLGGEPASLDRFVEVGRLQRTVGCAWKRV